MKKKKARVKKPVWYLRIVIVLAVWYFTLFKKVKVNKKNCEKLQWPYIVFASHSSFFDFVLNAKVSFPHHTNYISSLEEFIGREWLLRGAGCIPKSKFTKDVSVVKNTVRLTRDIKNGVAIYPEARYSLIGINEHMDKSLGKLVKMAKVPAIVMITNGDFIHQPQWRLKPKLNRYYEVDFKCVVTAEEVEILTAEEIQARIEENFVYDDYKWQLENKVKIKHKRRAENIHKVLYKCPHCGKDYSMRSKNAKLWCDNCGVEYEMNEYGQLICQNSESKFTHAPDWYRWEREEVNKEVESGIYYFEDEVVLMHLVSLRKGYIRLGKVNFKHDMRGLHVHGILDNGEVFKFDNLPQNTPSIHIDYNYKKRGIKNPGQALDINTINDTWFIFPQTKDEVVTKIHFAVEALYAKYKKEKGI